MEVQKFFIGDVVREKDRENGSELIIDLVEWNEGISYSTNLAAWFSAEELELVRRADEKSFKDLMNFVEEYE